MGDHKFPGAIMRVETTFVLNDPRLDSWGAATFRYYMTAYAAACHTRQNPLPSYWDHAAITRRARLDRRTSAKCLALLQQNCFISIGADGRLSVCGVEGLNQKLEWQNDDKRPPNENDTGPERGTVTVPYRTVSKDRVPRGSTARKKTRAVDPKIQEERQAFIGFWREAYQSNRGSDYAMVGGDAKAIPGIIRACGGLEGAKLAAKRMIEDTEDWIRKNTRITMLASRVNTYKGDGYGQADESYAERVLRETGEQLGRIRSGAS